MIINFSIQNYGPFKEEVILDFAADEKNLHLAPHYVRELHMSGRVNGKKLKLLRLALIYGANASGKSSVLHALNLVNKLVTSLPSDKERELAANPFVFQSSRTGGEHAVSQFKLCFYRAGVIYDYHVAVSRNEIVKEILSFQTTLSGQSTEVFTRSRQTDNNFDIHYGEKIRPTDTEKNFILTSLQPNTTLLALVGKKGNVRIEPILEAYSWFKDQLMDEILPDSSQIENWALEQLDKNNVKKGDVMRFERLSGFEFNDIRFEKRPLTSAQQDLVKDAPQGLKEKLVEMLSNQKQAFTQYVRDDGTFELELEQESLGTKRYLALSVVLAKLCGGDQSRVLPIDEIEHSLHPDLLEHFLTLFLKEKGNSQLIATTHYRELLDKELLIRRDAIWFTARDSKTLNADLYALTEIEAPGFRSTSNIANFYRAGRLGAVPKFHTNNEIDELSASLGS